MGSFGAAYTTIIGGWIVGIVIGYEDRKGEYNEQSLHSKVYFYHCCFIRLGKHKCSLISKLKLEAKNPS